MQPSTSRRKGGRFSGVASLAPGCRMRFSGGERKDKRKPLVLVNYLLTSKIIIGTIYLMYISIFLM